MKSVNELTKADANTFYTYINIIFFKKNLLLDLMEPVSHFGMLSRKKARSPNRSNGKTKRKSGKETPMCYY